MYGMLKSNVNTGADDELASVFITPLTIASNKPGFVTDSINLHRKVSTSDSQRWELDVNIAPTNESVDGIVDSLIRSFDTIAYARMPQVIRKSHGTNGKSAYTPVGANVGYTPTLAVAANYPVNSSLLNLSGILSFDLAKGEFIQFENDPKVYMVVEPGVDGLGFTIFPSLRQAVSIGDEIYYGDRVTLNCYYDIDNTFGIEFKDGILVSPGTMRLVEAL